jgi:hypothetical protein
MNDREEEVVEETAEEETPEPEVEEAPAMEMEADVAPVDAIAVVIKKKARVYRAPSFDAEVVGDMKQGDQVKIQAVSGVNVWVRVGAGMWMPFQAKGKQYLEMVD